MATLTFPGSPTTGQQHLAENGVTYEWTGLAWRAMGGGGGGGSSDWNDITNKPATFPPTLPIAQSGVTSLVADLALKAPLASPAFTGNPTAPTPTAGDNDTSLATTAFVTTAVASAVGGSTPTGPASGDLAGTYPGPTIKADVALTGNPTAPTPLAADNDTSIATTAFVKAQGYLLAPDLAPYAPLASPTFTGDPKAPTPTAGDNDTSIATTEYVQAALAELPVGGSALTGYWNYSSAALVPPPASGRIRLSVVWPMAVASSFHIYLADTDVDGYVYTWGVGPSVGDTVILRSASGARAQLLITALSVVAGYLDMTVTAQSVIGSYINNSRTQVSVLHVSAGPTGAAGGDLAGTYPNPTIKADVALSGNPTTTTQATATNNTTLATTAYVKAQGYLTTAAAGTTYQPLDGDLSALAALSTTGVMARTAADTYTMRTVTGTASRLSVTNGNGVSGNPTLDIDAAYVGQATITTLGTVATGTWQGSIIAGQYGGTGVNNAGKTVTLGGNLATSGAFAATFTLTGTTGVTFPTSGTLATTTDLGSYLTTATAASTYAPLAAPVFTGDARCVTPAVNDNDTSIATTAFVTTAVGIIQQNAQTGSYTLVAADAGKHLYHAVAAAAATYTIPANSSVAYPIGTTLTFVNDSANAVTIAITTDTLVLSPGTTTGSRTLATGGVATAIKVTSARWIINGSGLT